MGVGFTHSCQHTAAVHWLEEKTIRHVREFRDSIYCSSSRVFLKCLLVFDWPVFSYCSPHHAIMVLYNFYPKQQVYGVSLTMCCFGVSSGTEYSVFFFNMIQCDFLLHIRNVYGGETVFHSWVLCAVVDVFGRVHMSPVMHLLFKMQLYIFRLPLLCWLLYILCSIILYLHQM